MNQRLTGLILLVVPVNVMAIEPARVPLAGIAFVPTLTVSERYDNNIRNAPSDNDNAFISSWVTEISPRIILKAQDRLNIYQLSYGFSHDKVASSQQDSHTDHNAEALMHLDFDVHRRLDLYLKYIKRKNKENSTNNARNETGNESRNYYAGARYSYGTDTSKGLIEFGSQYAWLRYDNNLNTGSLTRERERNVFDIDATLLYRMTSKMQILAEFQYHDYDYTSATSFLGGDSQVYRLGVKWDATAKITGEFRIGQEKRNFNLSSRPSASNPSWHLGVSWSPRTYSVVTLNSDSFIGEGSSTENHIKSVSTTLSWKHAWSKYMSSMSSYSHHNRKYFGNTNDEREDRINRFSFYLNYELRRWLDVGVYYKYTDNQSNDSDSEFSNEVLGVTVDLSL